ncbi:MAG: hypothetical protein CYG60_26105 [Actinobacteria bacterium]|nr:MAG: hypothetical protein CYG60_26105 [Actinomycetota bacterium]
MPPRRDRRVAFSKGPLRPTLRPPRSDTPGAPRPGRTMVALDSVANHRGTDPTLPAHRAAGQEHARAAGVEARAGRDPKASRGRPEEAAGRNHQALRRAQGQPSQRCLPALVQLPIFLVLYYTIKEFEGLESFTTGGLFWFQDLTAADPYFILPIFYVATMMAAQEVTIRRTDPQQKGFMRAMPLIFGLFLAFGGFPSGLFVYWVTSNTITLCQNLILYRDKPRHTIEAKPETESRPSTLPSASPGDVASPTPSPRRKRRSKGGRKR